MSADPISQREFDAYVRTSAKINETTSKAVLAIQKQGQETLNVLNELVIVHSHHNQETNKRIIDTNKRIDKVVITQGKQQEAISANSSLTDIYVIGKKGFIVFLLAAVAAVGGYYGMKVVSPEKQEAKQVVIK